MTTKKQQGGDANGASPPAGLARNGTPADPAVQGRIVEAALDVVASIGFAQTKTEDIIATAGIGRRTFWKYFPDKTAALAAGYEQITRDLRAAVQMAHDQEPDPVRRVTACLTAIAGFLAADPARAEVFLVQGPCAGRAVIEIRAETMRRLAELLAGTIAELADTAAPPDAADGDRSQIVIESLAGGLYEIAYTRTFRGHVRELPELVPELADTILAPYRDRRAGAENARGIGTAAGRR